MTDTQTIQKGIRRSELKVFMKLFPVFRRFLKDRDSAKKNPEGDWSYSREINGRRAVDTFIDLGPTFIKLGQVLSARPDLLPREYIRSFERLQDNVPAAPFDLVKPIIERNLGKIGDVFDDFNTTAISGASLGQVYTATYKGKKVAVKVNRPDVENILRRDLIVIKRLLKLAKGRIENFLYISVTNVINDFDSRIYDEIDYRKEANNSREIGTNIRKRENAIIPEILEELSSKEVMVSEYIEGTKITDIDELKRRGIDLKDLAFRLDLVFMRMLLRDHIFHADPHPGNISVADDGRIIIYDYGMVGNLDDKTRFSLLSLYDGLVISDPDAIIDALLGLKALSPAANRGVIRRSIEIAIGGLGGRNPEDAEISELLDIANDVIFEFPFRLPRSLVLYMRLSSLLEGICMQLDPDFKFVRVLRKMLYEEGLLDELYRKQMEEFFSKSIKSIEKGLDVLPLLKRRLEEEGETRPVKESGKIPASVFLGFVLLSSVLFYRTEPIFSEIVAILDIIGFIYIMVKK